MKPVTHIFIGWSVAQAREYATKHDWKEHPVFGYFEHPDGVVLFVDKRETVFGRDFNNVIVFLGPNAVIGDLFIELLARCRGTVTIITNRT